MKISSDIRSRVLAYYAYLVNWPFLNKMLNKYCFCLNTMTIIEIVLKYNLNEIVLISITCFSGHIIEAKMETECLVTYRWPSKLSCLLVSTKRFWRRYAINFRYVEQQNLKKIVLIRYSINVYSRRVRIWNKPRKLTKTVWFSFCIAGSTV